MQRLDHKIACWAAGLALLGLGAGTGGAVAQTTLPGVVVTTPSPIVRPRPSQASPVPQAAADEQPSTETLAPGLPTILGDETFVPVTVVSGREIEANQGATLTDTLQLRPGISGSTFAPGSNRPVIRGLDTYRVRVQENGIGTHDVSALSEDHAVPMTPSRPIRSRWSAGRPSCGTARRPSAAS